jgi:ABC-type Fe3+ transport system substrate-binding protein
MMTSLVSGEATIGIMYKAQAATIAKRNPDLKWIFPSEGAISISWGTGIARNTPNREFAERFLDMTLDPKGQVAFVQAFNYPGTNRNTEALVAPAQRGTIGLTDEERARLVNLDQGYMSEQRISWMNRWKSVVASS